MKEIKVIENSASKQDSGISRRSLLTMAGLASVAFVQTSFGKTIQMLQPFPLQLSEDDPTKKTGRPPGLVGSRSTYETPVKKTSDTSSRTPLQDLYGTITPSDLHFERHHAGVPDINPNTYELIIHGMVDKPKKFTLQDLKRFPSVSRICFIECSGNYRTGKETMTPQEICGMTSQSEWTGVMLSTILREVGIQPTATWLLAEGGDAAVMTRSIPVRKALDDAMIVYAQNGEALRPQQGYPVRLLLPGWEGNTNIKWLRRIEVSDAPFMTREETSKYTETIKGGLYRQFSFDMDARSIITFPTYPRQVEKGWIEIQGIAWTGRGKVVQVDVTTDAGKTWQAAQLQEPVMNKAHVRFRFLWNWNGEETEIASRVTDETGYLQPFLKQLLEARGGVSGGYHFNPVTFWRLKKDGLVVHNPDAMK